MMKKVFVFGSLNMDLVVNSPCLPQAGETMYGTGFFTNPGGKGANQAVACGRLGAETYMGGAGGAGPFGEAPGGGRAGGGVDPRAGRAGPDCSSGIAVILVTEGDNRIILDGGANGRVTAEDADRLLEQAGEGDLFLCQLENPVEAVGYAMKAARRRGMYVILNPAPMNVMVREYLPCCDMLVLNETEFSMLGRDSLAAGSRRLLDMGIKDVVLTLGAKGYCHTTRGEIVCTEGVPVKAVDTTAAGDTFCGALAAGLAGGKTVGEALQFANKAAAITVTRRGAQCSIPTFQEVFDRYGG